jgi:hypothetical protein
MVDIDGEVHNLTSYPTIEGARKPMMIRKQGFTKPALPPARSLGSASGSRFPQDLGEYSATRSMRGL